MDALSAAEAFPLAFDESTAEASTPSVEEVLGVPGAFLIRGALSNAETDGLQIVVKLAHISHLPRRDSGTTTTRRESQHHKPVRVPVPAMATLCTRLRPHLPVLAGPGCEAVLAEPGHEISEFLRCYHYFPGDFSSPHFDRSFVRSANNVQSGFSAYSMLLYLADSPEGSGGHTTFFAADPTLEISSDGFTVKQDRQELTVTAKVAPCRGDVLVFPHGRQPGCHPNPLHEGSTVVDGEKLVIRTDVLYNCPPSKKGKAKARSSLESLKQTEPDE